MTGLDVAGIRARLPQRFPLLLVDRVISIGPGPVIRTAKAVTLNEPCFAALPDDAPDEAYDYPASLLIESIGQSAALLWFSTVAEPGPQDALLFAGARDVQLHSPLRPGEVVEHVVQLDAVSGGTAFASARSMAGTRCVAEVGTLIAACRPRAGLLAGGGPRSRPMPVS